MRHDQPVQSDDACYDYACLVSAESAGASGASSGACLARRGAARSVPMGSLVAALLVVLWLPSGPLMAAALISGEAVGIHAGLGSAGGARSGQKHTPKSSELRTLKRLSVALIIAVRSGQQGDAGPLAELRGGCPTDDLPLDRQMNFSQRWTNTAGHTLGEPASVGLSGGVRLAGSAGLIALPPPACA